MKLHQIIKNFYISSIKPLFQIEIETEHNIWNTIESINITEISDFYEIQTATHKLLCTKNHIIIDENGNEVLAVNSLGINIKTKTGIEKVLSVKLTDIKDNAYDVSLADNTNHLFYANDILSHNCVILDEFAFLQKNIADKLFTSMYPVISSSKNGKFIIVSTPNGVDNLYYDIWQKANSKEKGKNLDGWKPFEMFWFQVPGHDEKWKQQQIAAIGEQRFEQEFNNAFLANSSTKKLISDETIEKYRQRLAEYKLNGTIKGKKHKILSEQEDKLYEFTMWHEFDPKHTYVASGDISEGIGSDSSVLYVWDITDLRKITMCAKFSSNLVSVVEFAYIATKILALYGNPYFIAERNGCSGGTLDAMRITYKYPRLVTEGKNGEPGVFSHVTVKGKTCLWAREMLTTVGFDFVIYDKDLIDDWTSFVKKDTKGVHLVYHALPPAHDDFIMAFIWLCYILQSDIIEKYFLVATTFTSTFGSIYAQIVYPQKEYTIEEIKRVTNDPMYKDFLEFKEELYNKLGKVLDIEKKAASRPDPYGFVDPYFGDSYEPSWNGPQFEIPTTPQLNPNNYAPAFAINIGGGFVI